MKLLNETNTPDYLRSAGRMEAGAKVRVETLAGGVSNVVLRVDSEIREPFVIKQAREQLRTEAPWFSRLDRIWRETAAMEVIRPLLPGGAVPRILFEDRENYLFCMEAVDPRHTVWKKELLAGRIRPEVARRLAAYLAAIHGGTHASPSIAREFDDRQIFVELRVDPFYRHIARVHPQIAGPIQALIDEMWRTRASLVHADFSPKNVLIVDWPQADERITLVDFETAHYGDPAFDLGFFLSHLVLKGVPPKRTATPLCGLRKFSGKIIQRRSQLWRKNPHLSPPISSGARWLIWRGVPWPGSTGPVQWIIFRTRGSVNSFAAFACAC